MISTRMSVYVHLSEFQLFYIDERGCSVPKK